MLQRGVELHHLPLAPGGRSAGGYGEAAVGDVTWLLRHRGRGLAAAEAAPGGDWPRRRERARGWPGCLRVLLRGRAGSESPGESPAATAPQGGAEGPALPPLYSPSCAAHLIYRLDLAERTNTRLLQVLPCEALGRVPRPRQGAALPRQAVLLWPHCTPGMHSWEKGFAWCLLLWIAASLRLYHLQVNLYASCSKDHLFEIFIYFSQFFWTGFSLGMFLGLKFAGRAADWVFSPLAVGTVMKRFK